VSELGSVELPAQSTSPGAARRFVSGLIDDPGPFCDRVMLLVSELVANAVLHARTQIAVTVATRGAALRVEVRDGSVQLPMMRDYGPAAITGRGLRILNATSDRWGAEADDDGKTVWFEIDRASANARREA
jgi:anti-sigma regulatory factor (Ser/Thr protein kinase)